MSWETTLKKSYLMFWNLTKMLIKDANILHKWKLSKDVDKLLVVSNEGELKKKKKQNL
jgi:hypothetical protein